MDENEDFQSNSNQLVAGHNLLSKSIDRLYQRRRESGLTRYALLGVLVACSFYIVSEFSSVVAYGKIIIVYIMLWISILLIGFSVTFKSHIGVKDDGTNFYSSLQRDNISTILNGTFYILLVIGTLCMYLFRTNNNVYSPDDPLSMLATMSIIYGICFLFISFAIKRINEKYVHSLVRELDLDEVFLVRTILRKITPDILRIKYYTASCGVIVLLNYVFFVYTSTGVNFKVLTITFPYAMALTGLILAIFQFLNAQNLSLQITSLENVESQIVLNNNLSNEVKLNLINKYLYVPSIWDWFDYHLLQYTNRIEEIKNGTYKVAWWHRIFSNNEKEIANLLTKSQDRLDKLKDIQFLTDKNGSEIETLNSIVITLIVELSKIKNEEEE